MEESKIELHDRLRREGRWNEATVWKDAKIKELRATGMKRADAKEKAWRLMAEKFPPLPKPEPDEDDDDYGDDFDDELEDEDEDQEENELYDFLEAEDVYAWLEYYCDGRNWHPFLDKLVEMTKQWSQFGKQWCRDQDLSLDNNKKRELHQAVADFVACRLWPLPPPVTTAGKLGSPKT
ncbi:MAG: hypothetical protein WCB27_13485 [Thermoguttaceae bacterium]